MSLRKQILQEIFDKTIVKLAPSQINNAGVGVFTMSKIEKEDVVFTTNTNNFIQWFEIEGVEENISRYIKKMCNHNEHGFWIDRPVNKINPSYYVNHSENPNLYHHLQTDTYFAIKNIEIGEELTCKYLPEEIDWV
jgi:SET domain-containing protein